MKVNAPFCDCLDVFIKIEVKDPVVAGMERWGSEALERKPRAELGPKVGIQ
jgi:hypothetical protein